MSTDRFFSAVRTKAVATSAGPCELPILYTDASMLTLFYRVDPVVAAGLSADAPFEPWTILGNAVAVVCAFEYRATTIGPYGELGIGILVRRRGSKPSLVRGLVDLRKEKDAGLLVVDLPVTTESACAAGRELWGYPKYVTTMETDFGQERIRFGLGKELVLTMGKSRGPTTPGIPYVTYSVDPEGRVLRTIVDVDHRVRWGGARSVRIDVTGDGPSARTVKALALDTRAPVLAFRTDAMRSILPLGEEMGTVPVKRKADGAARAHGAAS
jgi:hypothetical protein